MGNCHCLAKKKKRSKRLPADITPCRVARGARVVRLFGPASCPWTSCLRILLLYKNVRLQFFPAEDPTFTTSVLQCGSETISGSYTTLLQYLEVKFPNPPLLVHAGSDRPEMAIVAVARLQHKSMTWHLDGLVIWAADMAARWARGNVKSVDTSVGRPRMEVSKFGRCYSQLLEVMLEHAQMEERVIFPILEKADRGLSTAANEEHARDLPIMNGIKEAIKSVGVLEAGSIAYHEAMLNLSTRLRTLQDHCKEHFEEEEKNLLPILGATELNMEQEEAVLAQCFEVMEGSHSCLLHFLMTGLLPQDAMYYLHMICSCKYFRQRAGPMLQVLAARMEGKEAVVWDSHKG